MGIVITIPKKGFFKRWRHKLFNCPTFWNAKQGFKARYSCSKCGAGYRCYWDANDITGHGTDICNKCAKKLENG